LTAAAAVSNLRVWSSDAVFRSRSRPCSFRGASANRVFDPRVDGYLQELEFFLRAATDPASSYATFQRHLEATFGPPAECRDGDLGFPACRWDVEGAQIQHYVFDRFAPRSTSASEVREAGEVSPIHAARLAID
jgi:hypothetical protein